MLRNILVLYSGFALIACGGGAPEPAMQKPASPQPSVQSSIIQDTPVEVVNRGQQAAGSLMKALKSELQQAMQDGGVMHAVSFCSGNALQLTAEVEADLGLNIDLKRVSTNYRNPANKPDKFEQQALKWMDEQSTADTIPAYFVQKITDKNRTRYRYYQPIRIQTPCLACHGPVDQMKPELKTLLKERYPDDRATGYQNGDLRGAIRVEILPVDDTEI